MNMQGLRRMSIKMKMVVAFLSVSFISILLLIAFFNYYYGKTVQSDFITISNEATTRLNHHMDYYFKQFQQSTKSLVQSDSIQDWLSEGYRIPDYDVTNVQKELTSYLSLNYPEISGMFLKSSSNQIVSMSGPVRANSDYNAEPWSQLPLGSDIHILPTHIPQYQQGYGKAVLSLMIPIYDIYSLHLVGNLIIDINLKEISDTFSHSNLAESGIFYILSPDNTIVYHPNKAWAGISLSETDLPTLELNDNRTTVRQWKGTRFLIGVSQNESTGWYIVSQVPFDEMASGLVAARNSTFYVALIIFIGIMLVAPLLSNSFSRPIQNLKTLMQQVAGGNFSVRAPLVSGHDEFQHLNQSFNVMVEKINELLDTVADLRVSELHGKLRQKEAVIKALQNQINPHLLYNSLDIIRSIAYLEKVPEVEIMARSLASVYRYSAKHSDKEVPLSEELQHLTEYLEIVRIRFIKFQIELHVDEYFHDCFMLKLTLQPIVENAVKYAVEASGKGTIVVSAYNDGEDLIIEITDDGPGIREERLAEISKQLGSISEHVNEAFVEKDSLGLANVHARLVLKYGTKYGLTVRSSPAGGTAVLIRLPFRKQESAGDQNHIKQSEIV